MYTCLPKAQSSRSFSLTSRTSLAGLPATTLSAATTWFGFHHTALGHDRPHPDFGPDAQNRSHTDDRKIAYGATVQYRSMAEGYPFPDPVHVTRGAMYDNAFLNGRPTADFNPSVVSPEDGPMSHIALLAHHHVSDQCRGGADIAVLSDNGLTAVETVAHVVSLKKSLGMDQHYIRFLRAYFSARSPAQGNR